VTGYLITEAGGQRMNTTKETGMLPTEPFWEAIATEEMEERLEFAPWTSTESITATGTCSADGTGCGDSSVSGTGTVSSGQSWGS
jgi:hypothetical protein